MLAFYMYSFFEDDISALFAYSFPNGLLSSMTNASRNTPSTLREVIVLFIWNDILGTNVLGYLVSYF